MKYIYVPLYRMAVSYVFNYGRRWSILEQMLLVECSATKQTAHELALAANLPHRLVVEALINLLRANWIEARSDDERVYFAATPAGQRRATEKTLPEQLQKDIRWDSVCVDRLTGHWMRADDLDLVYQRDLPDDAEILDPLIHTFQQNDATLRDLFRLNLNESLEPAAPQFRSATKPYARVGVEFEEVQTGLPPSAPFSLRRILIDASENVQDSEFSGFSAKSHIEQKTARDDLTEDDIIVGGAAHLKLLQEILATAKSTVLIHSCFLSPDTLRALLPDLENAGKRGVRVELLWGQITDPESNTTPAKVSASIDVLKELSARAAGRISLSPNSSGSHAKIIVYDEPNSGVWTTIIGSCNFLSSDFDWTEVSLRTRSLYFASQVLCRLLSNQLPNAGNWSGTARRLNSLWSRLKSQSQSVTEVGKYSITLITDHDHYGYVTRARDTAQHDIEITSDLYGLAAETSVLVPMETAAAKGINVRINYNRPSRFLLEEGLRPISEEIEKRGVKVFQANEMHAKYLCWDEDNLVISSFNWMATSIDSRRANGAEMGASIEGKGIRNMLKTKLQNVFADPAFYDSASVVGGRPS